MGAFTIFASIFIIIVFAFNIFIVQNWAYINDPTNLLYGTYIGGLFAIAVFLFIALLAIIISRFTKQDKHVRGLFMLAILSSVAMCISDFVLVSTPAPVAADPNGHLRTSTGYAVLITSSLSFIFLILSVIVPSQYQTFTF